MPIIYQFNQDGTFNSSFQEEGTWKTLKGDSLIITFNKNEMKQYYGLTFISDSIAQFIQHKNSIKYIYNFKKK